jgi:hypothetical protein
VDTHQKTLSDCRAAMLSEKWLDANAVRFARSIQQSMNAAGIPVTVQDVQSVLEAHYDQKRR